MVKSLSNSVLVTGGAGFIGSHLCQRLLSTDQRVICLDNFNDFYDPAVKRENIAGILSHDGFSLNEGDIRDAELVEKVFTTEKPHSVVHLAAMAGVRPSIEQPLLYNDVNLFGTGVILEAARRHSVSNFIFGSSSSVYGAQEKVPFSEKDPVSRPISPYAATKAAGEMLCYTYHRLFGLPVTCLRFFTVYGPRQRPEMAIHLFARKIMDGEPITVFGDGGSRRDYTYIDDILDGIVKSLANSHDFEIFNLGESRTVSLRELISLLEKSLGKSALIQEEPEQPGDVPITYADISHARKTLNYDPNIPVEQGIDLFVQWLLKGSP